MTASTSASEKVLLDLRLFETLAVRKPFEAQ
jgi:hypothetical protein